MPKNRLMAACVALCIAWLIARCGVAAEDAETWDPDLKKAWDDYAGRENASDEQKKLAEELKACKHKIVFETNRDGNNEIYIMSADGSNQKNLTNTPNAQEFYPHASYDGSKICYVAFDGNFANGRPSGSPWVCMMDVDGRNQKKLVEWGAGACWHPLGEKIAFAWIEPQYRKAGGWIGPKAPGGSLGNCDYSTHGVGVYDLKTGKTSDVPCTNNLKEVFNLCYSPDGKYLIMATEAREAVKTAFVVAEPDKGDWLWLVKTAGTSTGGCRPDWSWDGKRLVWNGFNYILMTGEINTADFTKDRAEPVEVKNMKKLTDTRGAAVYGGETYFSDWSPDGKYILYSQHKNLAMICERKQGSPEEKALADKCGWKNLKEGRNVPNRFYGYNVWCMQVDAKEGKGFPGLGVVVPLTFTRVGTDIEPDWVFVK